MSNITDITINGLMLGSIYTMVALGFALVFGISRIVNFAHGQLVMWGAYIAVYLTQDHSWPYLAAVPLVILGAAVLGVACDQLVFRFIGEENAMVASIGLIAVSQALAFAVFKHDPRSATNPLPGGMTILGTPIGRMRLVVLVVSLITMVIMWRWLVTSRTGRAMRALAQAPVPARLLGIRPHRITMLSFAIAGGLAGIAGLFHASLFSVDPETGTGVILKAFIVVVVGGLGSLPGVAIAGFGLGIIEVATTVYFGGEWVSTVGYGAMLAVLLLRPQGIAGLRQARVG